MHNVSLWNGVEYEYKIAENGNTQAEYWSKSAYFLTPE